MTPILWVIVLALVGGIAACLVWRALRARAKAGSSSSPTAPLPVVSEFAAEGRQETAPFADSEEPKTSRIVGPSAPPPTSTPQLLAPNDNGGALVKAPLTIAGESPTPCGPAALCEHPPESLTHSGAELATVQVASLAGASLAPPTPPALLAPAQTAEPAETQAAVAIPALPPATPLPVNEPVQATVVTEAPSTPAVEERLDAAPGFEAGQTAPDSEPTAPTAQIVPEVPSQFTATTPRLGACSAALPDARRRG
jgi:hypothetical protein